MVADPEQGMGEDEHEGLTTQLRGKVAQGPWGVAFRAGLLLLLCAFPPLVMFAILSNQDTPSELALRREHNSQGVGWAGDERVAAWLVSDEASAVYEQSGGGLLEMRHKMTPILHGVLWDETTQSPIK
eukprot:6173796-Pleurochrysis_carterae.AAC.2